MLFRSRTMREMPQVGHGFTHFSLTIFPTEINPAKFALCAMEPGLMWVNVDDAMDAAIPAPVKRILKSIKAAHSTKP